MGSRPLKLGLLELTAPAVPGSRPPDTPSPQILVP